MSDLPSASPPSAVPPPGRCYRVGGAVRDALLGLPVSDTDWVVVGSSPAAMIEAGFKPVGKDFPVFLHPQTHEEFALARTERKSAPGYRGFDLQFSADVTLEQDLQRRDLSVNAMALDDGGTLIDPHGGLNDLRSKVLRHVGPAFVEDPVRILRLARFAARFPAFSVAPETQVLMQRMVVAGEVHALVPERIWQEVSRGLMAEQPSRMLQVLSGCGAWAVLAPELATGECAPASPPTAPGSSTWQAVDRAARLQMPLPVRFASLAGAADVAAVESLAARWRVPAECRDAARAWSSCSRAPALHPAPERKTFPGHALDLLQALDALRRPARLQTFLDTAAVVLTRDRNSDPAFVALERAARAAGGVDQGAIARSLATPSAPPMQSAPSAPPTPSIPAARSRDLPPAKSRPDPEQLRQRIRAAWLTAIATDFETDAARSSPEC